MTGVEQPAMVDMWGLYIYEILAVYQGDGRPPAPDFRPKSYHVRRDRPPRPSGNLTHFYSHGVVRDPTASARETPCVYVSYRTPAINVVPVVEALLENPHFPAPWRIETSMEVTGVLTCGRAAEPTAGGRIRSSQGVLNDLAAH